MTDPIAHVEAQLQNIQRRMEGLHTDIALLVREKNDLRATLLECEAYFADRSDIKDGPEGQQLPNTEMQLVNEIRIALYGSTV